MNAPLRIAASCVAGCVWLLSLGCAGMGSQEPDVTHDGLVRVHHAGFEKVYVEPGANFSVYRRVQLRDCPVTFIRNWQMDFNSSQGAGLQGRVSSKQMDEIKADLSKLFREEFAGVLEKGGYSLTDESGPDVMRLRPSISDLDISAPDVMTGGSGVSYTTSAGSMTLHLEIYDSQTGDILARISDHRRGQNDGRLSWANSVSNEAEARRVVYSWATILVARLEQVRNNPGPATEAGSTP